MFYTQDYPEWVSKFELGLKSSEFNECIVEDDEVWALARENKEIPHVSNIWMGELFYRIENHLTETYGQDAFGVEYYANGMNSSLSVDGEDVMTYDDLQGVVDKKKLNKDKVIMFNTYDDVRGDLIAQVELTDEITIDVIEESKDNETRHYPFIYDNDGEYDYERLDFYWEDKPTEGILEVYDFSVHLNNYLDDIKGLEDKV